MSERFEDGHSAETCNYNQCKAIDPKTPCPFVKDDPANYSVAKDSELVEAASEHQHQYTIPVEYAYAGQHHRGNGTPWHYTGMHVTRLRCACGDEVAR